MKDPLSARFAEFGKIFVLVNLLCPSLIDYSNLNAPSYKQLPKR
jgi:hypothetical protein